MSTEASSGARSRSWLRWPLRWNGHDPEGPGTPATPRDPAPEHPADPAPLGEETKVDVDTLPDLLAPGTEAEPVTFWNSRETLTAGMGDRWYNNVWLWAGILLLLTCLCMLVFSQIFFPTH